MEEEKTKKAKSAMAGQRDGEDARAHDKPKSMLRLLHLKMKGENRKILFGAVSERVRTQLLTEDEADLIATWFARMAAGEDPKKILYGELRGRKRGGTNTVYLNGNDLKMPDHVDLCWSIRRAIARTGDQDKVIEFFAKQFGRTAEYVGDIYAQIEPTLGSDPDSHSK